MTGVEFRMLMENLWMVHAINSHVWSTSPVQRWVFQLYTDERGVKEAIYVKLESPSINRGGGLRGNLSATFHTVLTSLPKSFTPVHTLSLEVLDHK